MILVITAVILTIVITLGIVVYLMAQKTNRKGGKLEEPNYRAFFIMGIIVTPLSIISIVILFLLQIPFFIAFPLFIVGLTYLIIGWTHRDKWRKST